MRRTSNLVILVVALLMGALAAYLAHDWMRTHSTAAEAAPTAMIVVAKDRLAFGALITEANVREISWPADSAPQGAFPSVADLTKDGRRIVLSPFVRDEPIVASKVSAPNERASLSTVIEPGKRAITVAVDDVRGVAGFVFPGDFVDVALTRTGASDGPANYSEVILQHVKVLAIDQVASERQERPTVAKAVTVEVTPDEALKILLATNIGKLSLILRQPAETANALGTRVTDQDLFAADKTPSGPEPATAPSLRLPQAESNLRKVTIVRETKSEQYDVPKGNR